MIYQYSAAKLLPPQIQATAIAGSPAVVKASPQGSPPVQIRSARTCMAGAAPQAAQERIVMRVVPTPVRSGAVQSWCPERAIRVCTEGEKALPAAVQQAPVQQVSRQSSLAGIPALGSHPDLERPPPAPRQLRPCAAHSYTPAGVAPGTGPLLPSAAAAARCAGQVKPVCQARSYQPPSAGCSVVEPAAAAPAQRPPRAADRPALPVPVPAAPAPAKAATAAPTPSVPPPAAPVAPAPAAPALAAPVPAAPAQATPVTAMRQATPREALERDLTDPEKVNYSDLEFIESLGSGEFGQVFRGSYRGEDVAIKQLFWDNTVSEFVMQDLAKEIESFRHLRHKRLVRFIGACLEMPHLCLVTEYMPGGSLHNLLHVRKLQLPWLHATNMCLQVADGVMYLHSQNPTVVHRDLKSLNIVLDLFLNIKICDFGLTEPMERTHITKKNNGGSPRYMAPELFDSKTKITEKIDVWAMGCIFVEIQGGPLPYVNVTSLAELTREMLVHRRAPDVPTNILPQMRPVIESCLDFDYRLRPSAKSCFDQLRVAKKQMREAGLV